MSSVLTVTEISMPKQPSPLSIRIEPDLEKRLESLTQHLGKKRHAIAAAAIRLGVEILEKDQESFYQALIEAEKAKAAAAIAALKEEAKEISDKK